MEIERAQRATVSTSGFTNPLNLEANAEENSHVKVYGNDTLLTQGVDYTLDGVGDLGDLDEIAGVNVTFEDVAILEGYDTFTVVHEPPLTQATDLSSGGTLGRVYEIALDAIVRRMQSIGDLISRAVRLPVDASGVSVILPLPDPGKALRWNEAGDGLENSLSDPDSDGLLEASEFADAAAASALEAQGFSFLANTAVTAADLHQQAAGLSADAAAQSAIDSAAAAGDVSAVLAALEAASFPVGGSIMYNTTSAPTGYLKENGAAVSRATYAALFAVIGTTFGAGNGSTTFNVPESRGEFFRGLDDSRGIDTGRTIASAQAAMVGPHNHEAVMTSAGSHAHSLFLSQHNGFNTIITSVMYASNDDNATNAQTVGAATSTEGAHTHTIVVGNNTGTDTRPRNKAKLMCIKY